MNPCRLFLVRKEGNHVSISLRWISCISACFFLIDSAKITPSAAAKEPLFNTSYAVVIGVDEYQSSNWPSLPSARNDALAMSAILKAQGYVVATLVGPEATRSRILRELRDVVAPNLSPGDRVLLYFSGHGQTIERSERDFGYIIPHDSQEDDISTWISMAEIQTISEQMDIAQHQIFFFDSCYGGQISSKSSLMSLFWDHPRYIYKMSENKARQYITAGGKDDIVISEGPDGYSYFTKYLLKALEGKADFNGDEYISIQEVYSYLLSAASNDYQTPLLGYLAGHEAGEYWFEVAEQTWCCSFNYP